MRHLIEQLTGGDEVACASIPRDHRGPGNQGSAAAHVVEDISRGEDIPEEGKPGDDGIICDSVSFGHFVEQLAGDGGSSKLEVHIHERILDEKVGEEPKLEHQRMHLLAVDGGAEPGAGFENRGECILVGRRRRQVMEELGEVA